MKGLPIVSFLLFTSVAARSIEYEAMVFEAKRYTVCRVDLNREKLELFLSDEHGKPFNRFATLDSWLAKQGRQLSFGMNGGMYHGDFAPVGMFVGVGKKTTPVNLDKGEGNF